MHNRGLHVIIILIVGAIIIMYFVPDDIIYKFELPLVYFVIVMVLGWVYVWFGGRVATDNGVKLDDEGDVRGKRTNFIVWLICYGGAILFFGLAVQLLAKGAILGMGFGNQCFPVLPDPYENLSTPRLISWFMSGFLFLLAASALAFRSKHALITIAFGTIAFVIGAVYDQYFLEPDSYEPTVGLSSFITGFSLVIWFILVVMLRKRGALH